MILRLWPQDFVLGRELGWMRSVPRRGSGRSSPDLRARICRTHRYREVLPTSSNQVPRPESQDQDLRPKT